MRFFFMITLFASCNFYSSDKCITDYDIKQRDELILGVVKSIYRNENNHGLTSVRILNYDSNNYYNYAYSYQLGQKFYDEVAVGDSFIKHKGYLDVILIKPHSQKKLYKFYCSELTHDSI